MQFSNKVDVAEILEEGRRLYRTNLMPFMRYALLSVILSYFVSIYVAVFDTFFTDYLIIYVIGLIFLLLLYFPIIYYSVLITINNAEKLKNMIMDEAYNYKKGFMISREKFWRVFFIMLMRFILKSLAILAIVLPMGYFYSMRHPELLSFTLSNDLALPLVVGGSIVLITAVYLLIRTEFACLAVYWNIKPSGHEIRTSFRLTKSHLFSKMKVMFVAHIPGLILTLGSFTYILCNLEAIHPTTRWIYITLSMSLSSIFYIWKYAHYYPMLQNMKCMTNESGKTIDRHGREWLSF